MRAKLTAKELTAFIGSINRSAPKLTEGSEDSYLVQLAVEVPSLKGLTYSQVSNVLLRLQDFAAMLPAQATVQATIDLMSASDPRNAFLEAVKADYEKKAQGAQGSKEEANSSGALRETAG